MAKPVLTDYFTVLNKENMEPLFDLAWGAFVVPGTDTVAKTPKEVRDALGLFSSDLSSASYASETATEGQTDWLLPGEPGSELTVQVNGVTMTATVDYTLASDTVIFTEPLTDGDSLRAQYR